MSQHELNAAGTMKLMLLEALRDRRIDDDEKQKILALTERLGLKKSEVEEMLREAATQKDPAASTRQFDARALFASACELALQDGILTEDERRHLFALKDVLNIQDDWYSEQMQLLAKRCSSPADDLDEADLTSADLVRFKHAPLAAALIAHT